MIEISIQRDSSGFVLLVKNWSKIVGSLIIQISDNQVAEMSQLQIDEPFRRNGFGKKLVNKAELLLKEMGVCVVCGVLLPESRDLTVADLARFYESLGYEVEKKYRGKTRKNI